MAEQRFQVHIGTDTLAALHRVRDLVTFAKREHFEARGTRGLASLAGAIPVDRDGDARPALAVARQALDAGRSLLIHPEGTRTKSGALGPFRPGAALLSLETGIPLIPVRIRGAFQVFPESRKLPRLWNPAQSRRHKIEVSFGLPLYPSEAQNPEELTERLRATVEAQ